MAVDSSLAPLPAKDFGPAQARHLLNRAGFGGSPADVDEMVELGLDGAVDVLIAGALMGNFQLPDPPVDADVITPPDEQERMAFRNARRNGDEQVVERIRRERLMRQRDDNEMYRDLQRWWLGWMINTPRPMQEKLVLLWHSHFATRHRNVRDTYLMYQQNCFFREHACGSFADLAHGIVRDPAMLVFLNNDRNIRREPNENLARELMELFTLGEGNYSESDIKQGARALTGYHVEDNDFRFRKGVHDTGSKTILGRKGKFDGDDFVSILLRKKSCAQFVAFKLYRYFVADISDDPKVWTPAQKKIIEQMAGRLIKDGYEMAPVLAQLLRSRHFYDAENVGTQVKSPAQLLVGTTRSLELPHRNYEVLTDAMRMMGQVLFDPPSVAGWDGGRGWMNTSTLFVRQNVCTYMITGMDPRRGRWRKGQMGYDPQPLIAGVEKTPRAIVDNLVDAMIGEYVSADRRTPLVAFMSARDEPAGADSLTALLVLITAMPEYQLC